MGEPWKDDPADDAVCAECGTPIDLDDCGKLVEDVAEAPDGLPAMIFVAVCKDCEADHLDTLDSDDET